MRRNRTEGRSVVHLDETGANAYDGKSKAWVEDDKVTGGTKGCVRLVQYIFYLSWPYIALITIQ